jgi:dissimilatory sulfite reductase (desulfoviridin) alpha/beta subunit
MKIGEVRVGQVLVVKPDAYEPTITTPAVERAKREFVEVKRVQDSHVKDQHGWWWKIESLMPLVDADEAYFQGKINDTQRKALEVWQNV